MKRLIGVLLLSALLATSGSAATITYIAVMNGPLGASFPPGLGWIAAAGLSLS